MYWILVARTLCGLQETLNLTSSLRWPNVLFYHIAQWPHMTPDTWYLTSSFRRVNVLCSIILLTGRMMNFLRLPNVPCSIILLSGHLTSSLYSLLSRVLSYFSVVILSSFKGLLSCVLSYCSQAPPGFHTVYRRLDRRLASSQGSSCTPPAGPRWRSTWHLQLGSVNGIYY